ncbi:MAG: hypothetical protein Q9227_000792 [Pyrenula ochraceoflavens]
MSTTVPPAQYAALQDRPMKGTIALFDVDLTLTYPRQLVSNEMMQKLKALRGKCAIGFVGGSNLAKQQEQLSTPDISVTSLFDFCFAENGLTAYRLGQPLPSTSFISHLGENNYQRLARFCLRYIADEVPQSIPKMRGTFIEFRNGMVNISPIGRNASTEERNEFQAWDLEHGVRKAFVSALEKEFHDLNLKFSIGGQISFDAFPEGWDKTFCLRHVLAEKERSGVEYKTIHFFGDKCFEGGNDWEIYQDDRTVGHAVKNPEDTLKQLEEVFGV